MASTDRRRASSARVIFYLFLGNFEMHLASGSFHLLGSPITVVVNGDVRIDKTAAILLDGALDQLVNSIPVSVSAMVPEQSREFDESVPAAPPDAEASPDAEALGYRSA